MPPDLSSVPSTLCESGLYRRAQALRQYVSVDMGIYAPEEGNKDPRERYKDSRMICQNGRGNQGEDRLICPDEVEFRCKERCSDRKRSKAMGNRLTKEQIGGK